MSRPQFQLTLDLSKLQSQRLDEPLREAGSLTVPTESATVSKWKVLVETFKIVSDAMKTGSDQPLVAIGGFAMFLLGDTNRDPADIDFWTTEKGSEDLQQLLEKND